jgi:hypothetical protein
MADPKRQGPESGRMPPRDGPDGRSRSDRDRGQGYGNVPGIEPGIEDVEAWHQGATPEKRPEKKER